MSAPYYRPWLYPPRRRLFDSFSALIGLGVGALLGMVVVAALWARFGGWPH